MIELDDCPEPWKSYIRDLRKAALDLGDAWYDDSVGEVELQPLVEHLLAESTKVFDEEN